MLTDFAEIWWLVCNITCQRWRRISLKSDVVCHSYGNVHRGTVFSWTRCGWNFRKGVGSPPRNNSTSVVISHQVAASFSAEVCALWSLQVDWSSQQMQAVCLYIDSITFCSYLCICVHWAAYTSQWLPFHSASAVDLGPSSACSAEQGPHRKRPHRLENVGQQRNIVWTVRVLFATCYNIWSFTWCSTWPRAGGGALYDIWLSLNFMMWVTYSFPEQKIYVRATEFLPNAACGV